MTDLGKKKQTSCPIVHHQLVCCFFILLFFYYSLYSFQFFIPFDIHMKMK